ncbi:TrmB family transcriptional regulator, partial [Candidatus Woesearchaeota archaeon]|nr:TrmB family transcriptional regulator [Candidatus Woesearchaeota archaeon]
STAGELSDIANVPRSRSYDVLESLEKKGFIIVKLGKPIKYIAVPPEEVVERVKKKIDNDAKKNIDNLNTIKESDILKELKHLHKKGVELVEPTDLTAALKGRNAIHDHLDLLINESEKNITIVTTNSGIIRKLENHKKSLKKASERNVKIHIAAPIDTINPKQLKDIETIKNLELRELKNIKSRFIIIDSKEIIFMLLDDEQVHPTYDVGIWVNTPFFASALEQLFELAWKNLPKIKTN